MRGKTAAVEAIKNLSGVNDLITGFREAIIMKVDLNFVNDKGWFVKFVDTEQSAWVYNYAMPVIMPEGEVKQGFLVPTEELRVLLDQRHPDGNWIIRGYQLERLSPGNGELKFGRGDSVITVVDGMISITAGVVKINGKVVS